LKRLKDRPCCVRVFLPGLEDRELIINEAVGLALRHFDSTRTLVVQDQQLHIPEVLDRIDIACGALFNSDLATGFVHVVDRPDVAVFVYKDSQPHRQVGIAEIDRFLAILRHRQRRNDHINFTRFQGGDQSVEWDVLESNGPVQVLAHRPSQIHAYS